MFHYRQLGVAGLRNRTGECQYGKGSVSIQEHAKTLFQYR
jgi:hypothetical protein